MTRLLERIPLPIRLALLVGVPLVVITLEAGARLQDVRRDQVAAERSSEELDRVTLIGQAIRQLQIERDLTVQYLTLAEGDPGRAALRDELADVRASSEAAIEAAGLSSELPLNEEILAPEPEAPSAPRDQAPGNDEGGGDVPAEGRRQLGEGRPGLIWMPTTLTELRSVDVVSPERIATVTTLYTDLLRSYHDELLAAAGIDGGAVPASYLVSYQNIALALEQMSQVRVMGLRLLADPDPDPADLRILGQTSDQERFFIDQSRRTGQPDQQQLINDLLGAPGVLSFIEVRRTLLQRGADGGITRDLWLARSAERIEALRTVTDSFLAEVELQVDHSVGAIRSEYARIFTVSSVVLLFVAVGAWLVSRSISRPLGRLALAARAASKGRIVAIDVSASKDAIGEIGRAYRALNGYLHEVAEAAEGIARGDLKREIAPRSPEDRLGTALATMTRQLSSMVSRSRQRSRQLAETVDQLQESVSRDALTGLISRTRFESLLSEQVAEARAARRSFGVLFIDLDGFKPVNDTLGHDAGDELLREVARRLTGAVRAHDVVGRLGGDEFTVLLNDPRDMDALRMTARRVVEMVRVPYQIGGRSVQIGASVGVARYPDHGRSAAELLKASDQAMYEAKHSGGGGARMAGRDTAA